MPVCHITNNDISLYSLRGAGCSDTSMGSLEKCLSMMRLVRHCCSLAVTSAQLSCSPLLQGCAKEKVRNCLGFTLLALNRLVIQLF